MPELATDPGVQALGLVRDQLTCAATSSTDKHPGGGG